MKVKLDNIGPLYNAEFGLGDLTIICGENNTGKTYAAYALYGFLSFFEEVYEIELRDKTIDNLLRNGSVRILLDDYIVKFNDIMKDASNAYSRLLSYVFASDEERYKKSKISIVSEMKPKYENVELSRSFGVPKKRMLRIDKKKGAHTVNVYLLIDSQDDDVDREVIEKFIQDFIKEILFEDIIPSPFIVSAERTGAAIFKDDLFIARNRIIDHLSENRGKVNFIELFDKAMNSYAMPVKNNIEFMQTLNTVSKKKSYLCENNQELLKDIRKMVGGDYKISKDNEISFIPAGTAKTKLKISEGSSGVRSLALLSYYLNYNAENSDLLIIDEPELNLHPQNQRKMARLIIRLVNTGMKVVLTTHSDYIVKEINTMIMLNSQDPHVVDIRKKAKYLDTETLAHDRVRVYVAEKHITYVREEQRRKSVHTLVEAKIDKEYGIELKSFDDAIREMDKIQRAIAYGREL